MHPYPASPTHPHVAKPPLSTTPSISCSGSTYLDYFEADSKHHIILSINISNLLKYALRIQMSPTNFLFFTTGLFVSVINTKSTNCIYLKCLLSLFFSIKMYHIHNLAGGNPEMSFDLNLCAQPFYKVIVRSRGLMLGQTLHR